MFGYDGFVSDTSSAGTQDQLVGLVLDRTSFYAEAGGQVHLLPMAFCVESLCEVGKIDVGDIFAEPTQALDLYDACEPSQKFASSALLAYVAQLAARLRMADLASYITFSGGESSPLPAGLSMSH